MVDKYLARTRYTAKNNYYYYCTRWCFSSLCALDTLIG